MYVMADSQEEVEVKPGSWVKKPVLARSARTSMTDWPSPAWGISLGSHPCQITADLHTDLRPEDGEVDAPLAPIVDPAQRDAPSTWRLLAGGTCATWRCGGGVHVATLRHAADRRRRPVSAATTATTTTTADTWRTVGVALVSALAPRDQRRLTFQFRRARLLLL